MSQEMLELTVDKFTFRVPGELFFNEAGVWVKPEGGVARLGLSDFAQQRSGDIAFAEIPAEGTKRIELDRTEIFTQVALQPEIVVRADGQDQAAVEKRVRRALASAQKYSLVASSIKGEVIVLFVYYRLTDRWVMWLLEGLLGPAGEFAHRSGCVCPDCETEELAANATNSVERLNQ